MEKEEWEWEKRSGNRSRGVGIDQGGVRMMDGWDGGENMKGGRVGKDKRLSGWKLGD